MPGRFIQTTCPVHFFSQFAESHKLNFHIILFAKIITSDSYAWVTNLMQHAWFLGNVQCTSIFRFTFLCSFMVRVTWNWKSEGETVALLLLWPSVNSPVLKALNIIPWGVFYFKFHSFVISRFFENFSHVSLEQCEKESLLPNSHCLLDLISIYLEKYIRAYSLLDKKIPPCIGSIHNWSITEKHLAILLLLMVTVPRKLVVNTRDRKWPSLSMRLTTES